MQLLEEHFEKLREEQGLDSDAEVGPDEDDEAAWEGWDVESEEDSSDSGDWKDVSDDDDDIMISDSDDEKPKKTKSEPTIEAAESAPTPASVGVSEASTRISTLATTKVTCLAQIRLVSS